MTDMLPGAGWHPDPGGTPQYRYWDGSQWTEHLAPFDPQLTPSAAPRRRVSIALVVGAILLSAVVITALLVAWRKHSDNSNHASAAPHSVVAKVSSIPKDVFAAVGRGNAGPLPTALPGPVLTKEGKPRIVYMGSEYCPYCATERWAMIAALSRFGTFHNVRTIYSAGIPEAYPDTPTFSFDGASYSSPYITFEGVEMRSNKLDSSGLGYAILDIPTAEQRGLMATYDAPPYVSEGNVGAIPFIDFADTYLISGSTYSPQVLQGKSYDEIATAMADPSTDVSRGAIGSANLISAAICKLTGDAPSKVCSDPAIQSIESDLASR